MNISIVTGVLPLAAIAQMRASHTSIAAPHAPMVHANYRYLELTDKNDHENGARTVLAWRFGGGSDLSPAYPFAAHFHRTLRAACAARGSALYPRSRRLATSTPTCRTAPRRAVSAAFSSMT